MNSSQPLISVIIPVYNTELYLAEAIESVLAQTYQPFEVIVVDDGSTDGSATIAKKYIPSIKYHFQPNSGTAAARNKGIELAQGEFIAFLDADDLWVKEKLAWQIAAFESNPELDIVFGQVKQFYSPDMDENSRKKIKCPDQLMPGHLPSTMLIKRDALFRVGLFETHWQVGQDMSWYLRSMEAKLKTMVLPEMVHMRRLHGKNKGIVKRHLIEQRLHILKSSLDCRRKMSSENQNQALKEG